MPLSDKDILGLNRGFPMPTADPKPLRDLQTRQLVTEMQQTGATERSTASDLSRLRGVVAPQGLMPSTLTPEYLDPIRGRIAAKLGGEAISSAAAGGVRFPEGTPAFALPETYQQKAEAGFPLKAEAAALAAAKFQAEEEEKVRLERIRRLTPEEGGGFGKEVTERRIKQVGTTKGGPATQQRAEDLQRLITNEFGKNAKIVGETDTHFSISIDGAEPVSVRKNIVKRK